MANWQHLVVQQRRLPTLGTLSVLIIGLTLGFLNPQVTNAASRRCDHLVVGTYLTTVTDADGNVMSRSILTLSGDGTLASIESNQDGLENVYNPFSDAQGSWQCTGIQTFTATSLNFTLAGSMSPDRGIARTDYKATVDKETHAVEGTIKLRFFSMRANPLKDKVPAFATFSFTGQHIP
jgi:hypothetical protein